ncbi:MAG TPA: HupE/UreJ family protein [Burkholderiales bacterium]|jgi:hypothetical protein
MQQAHRLLAGLLLAVALLGGATAHAHFPAGYDLRAVHFEHAGDGLHAYFRLTLPLVVAAGLGPKRADGNHEPAPFTVLRIESNHGFYYPDVERIRAEPLALARLIADGHRLETDAGVLVPQVRSVRVYPKGYVPPFNTLAEVKSATAPGEVYPQAALDTDVAYVAVDAHLVYPASSAPFRLSSTLVNRVIGQPDVQNLLVDHREAPVVYRRTGLLDTPIEINPSAWSAAATFVREGVAHILHGADHLLFVLCLTLASATLVQLAWRVTGFTVGHTITLIAGFFGFAPQAPWFIPAVETAIAVSIALAALLLLRRASGRLLMPGLTLAIGLIHGFGFSFSLREMLQLEGPHLWLSLLSFNVGVEIGQIAFAAVVWLLAVVALQRAGPWQLRVRAGVALGCTAVSLFWIYERGHALLA